MIMSVLRFVAAAIVVLGISLMVIPVVGIILGLILELFK